MEHRQNLVSVIIPCYNAGNYLKESLQSVLNQVYKNLEIILINDGSTDDTEDIIKSFADERIKYFFQKNKGQCAASNLGLSYSTGDYIKFFDADDLMNPEHIESQVKKLDGSKKDIASSTWGRFYDNVPASAIFTPETVWKDMKSVSWLKAALSQKYEMLGACLWMIPREILRKSGGWDERLSLNNDFEFSTRLLLESENVLFTKDAKIYYRAGLSGSLSQDFTEEKYKAAVLSTELACQRLLNAENSKEMKLICANHYQKWLYRIYPNHPELVKYLDQKIKELGGSDRKMDGGKVAQVFTSVLGWKNTKVLIRYLKRAGYKKLPFN